MKRKEEQKLYTIKQDPAGINGGSELFTWKDACEILKNYQEEHPDLEFEVQEFEPI